MSVTHLFIEDGIDDEDSTGKIHFEGNGNTYTLCGLGTAGDSSLNLKEGFITTKKVNCQHCITKIEAYVEELESENKTLKLEQKQCLLCTAKHKEEKAELIECLNGHKETFEVLKELFLKH